MASAGAVLVALTAIQTDYVSRRILAPDRLEHKRHSEFRYRWSNILEKVKLALQFYCAGSITDGQQAEDEELIGTNIIDDEEQLKALVEQLVAKNNNNSNNGTNGSSNGTRRRTGWSAPARRSADG